VPLGGEDSSRGEAFDLAPRPLNHHREVRDELLVYRVVCGVEAGALYPRPAAVLQIELLFN
jgi:hypothetical protein